MPAEVWESLEAVKDNDEAVRKFGIDYCIDMCRDLLNRCVVVLCVFLLWCCVCFCCGVVCVFVGVLCVFLL